MINLLAILEFITCRSKKSEKEDEISQMKIDLQLIKENHLYHIEKDIAEMKTDIKLINQSLTDLKIYISKKN